MQTKQKLVERIAVAVLIIAGICTVSILGMFRGISVENRKIYMKHEEIETLQKRLISAQITTSRLDQVKKLIRENMALSEADSLTQGASLQFLKALTGVLDQLKIKLIALEPQSPVTSGQFVETPYKITIQCTYEQFCRLQNKMEKSSRLISLSEFTLENFLEEYFNSERKKKDLSRITMQLTTLTLVKE